MAKVLTVITGKGLGGSKQVFFDYCKLMTDLGHEVIPVIRKGSLVHKKFVADYPQLAARAYFVSYWRIPFGCWKKIAAKFFKDLYAKEKFDLIFSHKPIDAFFASGADIKCPIITVVHGFSSKYLNYSDHVIAVSNAVNKYLKERNVYKPITTIHNFLISQPETIKVLEEKTPFVMGTMCVFRKTKNLVLLIKSAALLKKRGIKIKLLIAGRGLQKITLCFYRYILGLKAEVEILPWVQDKAQFFNRLDLFCVTSRFETFNLTIIEAMSHGVPVISTACQGPREIIFHGQDGWLVYSDSPSEYACALENLICNRELRRDMVTRGREKVSRQFTKRSAGEALQNLLNNMLIEAKKQ